MIRKNSSDRPGSKKPTFVIVGAAETENTSDLVAEIESRECVAHKVKLEDVLFRCDPGRG